MTLLKPTWVLTTVSELAAVVTKGTTPTTHGFEYLEDGVRFVKVECLKKQRIQHDQCMFIGEDANEALKRSQLRAGDVLISIAGTLGRVAIVDESDLPANTNQAVAIIRLTRPTLPQYLAYTLESSIAKNAVNEGGQGVGLQNLNLGQVSDLPILLAPLPEQHRIVAALESYLSRLHDAIASLQRVQRNLKRYRASVLKAAVEGHLVPTEAELTRHRRVEAASRRFTEFEEFDSRKRRDAASTIANPNPTTNAAPTVAFFNPKAPLANTTGNLPHWRQSGRTYFVTFRLADSLPKPVSERIRNEREQWIRSNPLPHTKAQRAEYYRLFSKVLDAKLDAGMGSCVLAQPAVRTILRNALYFFDGEKYFLHDWVIMPNHVHILLTMRHDQGLSKTIHSIKSFSAKKINKLLGRSGTLWQKEYFDHIVRNEASFMRLREYIAENPREMEAGGFCLGQELTPWDEESITRRDAASTFEPASLLLERILAERKARWIEDAVEKGRASAEAKARKFGNPWAAEDDARMRELEWAKATKKYKEPVEPDSDGLPELPEGWCWSSLDHFLVGIEAGKNFKCIERPPQTNEVGIVKVSAVSWGTFDENESKTCPAQDLIRIEHLIRTGNFLLSRANTIELVGACVIVASFSRSLMLSDKILRLRFAGNLDWWLLWVLRSAFGRQQIESLATGNQESMRNISQANLRRICIPTPPASEIPRVLAAISEHFAVIERTEDFGDRNKLRIHRLRQSILKWAFEGKLVDQDPNDEPASALLERIKAERAVMAAEQKKKKRARKKL